MMADRGQGEIGDPLGIRGLHVPQDDEDDNEVSIGGHRPITGAGQLPGNDNE